MASERARVVVIGGGVMGCAILWELARRGIPGLLLEAEPDVCEGTSKANSGIVHTGFDAHPGTVEARMLRDARDLWPGIVGVLGVPYLQVGAIMLACDDIEAGRLRTEVAVDAAAMDVQVELLDRGSARAAAPYLAPQVVAALSIPGEAVVDPFWLTRAFAEAATAGGAEVRLRSRVTGLEVGEGSVAVEVADGTHISAEQVIDAAGLHADDVARMAGDRSFAITPRKGQFVVVEESVGVDRIVLPIPGPRGKGMLVTPISFGGLLLGPTAVDGTDKSEDGIDAEARASILAACGAMVPELGGSAPVRQFAGLRHVSSTGDFIVRPSAVSDRLWLVAGIRSTGISTSPAIARMVVAEVAERRGWALDGPARTLTPVPVSFPETAGEVVCLCRSVVRAEVEAAADRPTDPSTLDGLKRRAGVLFGDCQGNLCAVDVARILAARRGVPLASIEQHRAGSWLWRAGPARRGAASDTGRRSEDEPGPAIPTQCDVVIVGGGSAGSAVRRGLGDGLRVLIVDRWLSHYGKDSVRATAVGLERTMTSWVVLAQTTDATIDVTTAAVVLATGGYIKPAEHLGIAGPRPAGVMTSDRAVRILAAGLVPGDVIGLVGTGDAVDHLASCLTDVGARVHRLDAPPLELRGRVRIDAIRTREGWLDVDTLVLADVVLAQTFLLRGLGLVNAAPGRPAPVDDDGRLPLPGLWATGCCVHPDPHHSGCASDGEAVGRRVAASLGADVRAQPSASTL